MKNIKTCVTALAVVAIMAVAAPPSRAELIDRVVAVVGGEIITWSELRAFSSQSPDAPMETVLETLIENLLIKQEAEREGISVSDAEVEASLQSQMAQMGVSQAEFKKILSSEGVTIEQLEDRIRARLMTFKFVQQQIRGGIDISEEEMLNFYKLNPDLFQADAEVHLEHIFLPFPMSRDMEQRENVRKMAMGIRKRISEGEDFTEIAKQQSRGGGDLGWMKPDQMMPSFAKAINDLKTGDISDPFETDQGMHILKVVEFKASDSIPFDDVRDRIYAYLYDQRMQEELFRLVGELKERTPIERKL